MTKISKARASEILATSTLINEHRSETGEKLRAYKDLQGEIFFTHSDWDPKTPLVASVVSPAADILGFGALRDAVTGKHAIVSGDELKFVAEVLREVN